MRVINISRTEIGVQIVVFAYKHLPPPSAGRLRAMCQRLESERQVSGRFARIDRKPMFDEMQLSWRTR